MITARQPIFTAVSWSSAFAGALSGLIIFTALTMLGLGIAGESMALGNLSQVGWGSLIWLGLCVIVTAYICGFITARSAPGFIVRSTGMLNGILAGCLLLVAVTFFSYNIISASVRATLGLVSTVASAGATAAGAAVERRGGVNLQATADRVGLGEEYRTLSDGIDRGDLERAIREAAPELSQVQVTAATNVVTEVVDTSRRNVVTNVSRIGEIRGRLQQEWQRIREQLTGDRFVQRLQREGLTPQQAQQVSGVVESRLTQLQQRADRAVAKLEERGDQFIEGAGTAVASAAWVWLLIAGLIVGLSALGGYSGTDVHAFQEDVDLREHRGVNIRESLHH